ncbi:ribosomal-processing cysteine protease Prp [Peribacillus acanthi]|uniref:ribosomal-processing cysteine protease Prp n=1 Tax=Peribacillus acanthi TaxID=2171554 RepID=UPI000D3EDC68|nr:ribosomal-processing cysteine protease Prp [Peribacillus acanthi]
MITIKMDYRPDGRISSFTLNGHANFAKHGQDIVCAGVSAVSFGAVNSIFALTDVQPKIDQGGNGGYLHCEIPEDLPKESQDKVQLILETMLVSLQTIERDYGKYMKITLSK